MGIAQKESLNERQESDQCPREYGARIFHRIHEKITSYKFDFVVIWNTTAHRTVSIFDYVPYNHIICCQISRL